jgi:hypothetical protein
MHLLLFNASGLPEEEMIYTLKHYNLRHVIHTDALNNLQCISWASPTKLALLAAYGNLRQIVAILMVTVQNVGCMSRLALKAKARNVKKYYGYSVNSACFGIM